MNNNIITNQMRQIFKYLKIAKTTQSFYIKGHNKKHKIFFTLAKKYKIKQAIPLIIVRKERLVFMT